jgi:hypothetical protein
MLKIGIFGDSFGYEESIFKTSKTYISDLVGKSWVTLLRDYAEISNFCEPGSDLYFSYKNFIDNYNRFDKTIFLITNFNRFSFKFDNKFVHAHSVNSANAQLLSHSGSRYNAIKASIDYFLYLQDDEKDKIVYDLLLNDIKSKKSKISFINCFGSNSLNEIMQKENRVWNLPNRYTFKEKFTDIRKSHLTSNNNKLLFNKVLNWIIDDITFDINVDDFYEPNIDEKHLYIIDR